MPYQRRPGSRASAEMCLASGGSICASIGGGTLLMVVVCRMSHAFCLVRNSIAMRRHQRRVGGAHIVDLDAGRLGEDLEQRQAFLLVHRRIDDQRPFLLGGGEQRRVEPGLWRPVAAAGASPSDRAIAANAPSRHTVFEHSTHSLVGFSPSGRALRHHNKGRKIDKRSQGVGYPLQRPRMSVGTNARAASHLAPLAGRGRLPSEAMEVG